MTRWVALLIALYALFGFGVALGVLQILALAARVAALPWPSGVYAFPTRVIDARDHVLIGCRPDVAGADAALAPLVTDEVLRAAVDDVPDEWLSDPAGPREAYVATLRARLAARPEWVPALVAAAAEGTAGRTPRRPPDLGWLRER